ncbi:MAG: helix-turn-helix transcriptional regulator [Chitinophagales bacterium]|nr:helix-turn-helix transcriptional regulator [Chitinophagales bacterium]
MDITEKLAVKLRVLREVNNYTQEYVANVLDISSNTYSLLEKGQATLSIDRIEKLAVLYNMSVVELVSLADQNFFGKITTANGVWNETVNVHNTGIAEEERQLYKDAIARLEEQNNKLMVLLEKLSGKI